MDSRARRSEYKVQKSVLIVEDNFDTRKMFRDLLEVHGFQTFCAANGSDALSLAKEHRPDLILMDVKLDGRVSGVDAVVQIRSDHRLKGIPVVAVTAFAMRGDEERMIDAGFDGYLPKPVSIDDFLGKVEEFTGPPTDD